MDSCQYTIRNKPIHNFGTNETCKACPEYNELPWWRTYAPVLKGTLHMEDALATGATWNCADNQPQQYSLFDTKTEPSQVVSIFWHKKFVDAEFLLPKS